jgi:hypothetical protein
MVDAEQGFLLLQLPDSCLLAVLQCLSEDASSLCRAAKAHSRLHQAAVVVLDSISTSIKTQQQLDLSMLPYLSKHGQHVGHIYLKGRASLSPRGTVSLRQLPLMTKLTSLAFFSLDLQLQAGDGFQGVLGAAGLPLKQLQLEDCTLLDGVQGLAAALSLLPGLEQLWACELNIGGYFPFEVLQRLQQLTSLKIVGSRMPRSPGQVSCGLTPLQALTRLVELEFSFVDNVTVTADALSSMCGLTFLRLSSVSGFVDPGALVGKSRLQHLDLSACRLAGDVAWAVAQLLSQLELLQHLTHLKLACSLASTDKGDGPAAAYAALTASSTLQHLDVCGCTLPVGVWQHIFPAGRQLPHLQTLNIAAVKLPAGGHSAAPDGNRLVDCCPGLQELEMLWLLCNAEQLTPLSRLSGLTRLSLNLPDGPGLDSATQSVCQLTGLRALDVKMPRTAEAARLLLQVTQLQQLTSLQYWMGVATGSVTFESEVRPGPQSVV